MRTAAVICEYNPFHNGHKYQLDKIRETHDRVIALMSGDFVQRGDIAATDKWTRAKAALLNGCDLVLQLPVCFSLNSAGYFASGAVKMLNRLNVADTLAFGAETDDLKALEKSAELIASKPPEQEKKIKEYMSAGLSYPVARQKAYKGIANISSAPNDILALEYLTAINATSSKMQPCLIPRTNTAHDSNKTHGIFASASHIRELIADGKDYFSYIPKNVHEMYSLSDFSYSLKNIDMLILGYLRLCSADRLKNIHDMEDGLENRLKTAADKASSFNELCMRIKTKRYTLSRIRRIVLSSVLGLDKVHEVNYIRVLGMNSSGKRILKDIKEKSDMKIIIKTADYRENDSAFMLDIKASDIFSLCSLCDKTAGRDFLTSPVILN